MFNNQVYEAFFEELSRIEQQAMLQGVEKDASLGSSTVRGLKGLIDNPGRAAGTLRKAWEGGVKAQAKRVGTAVHGPVQPGAALLGSAPDVSTLSAGQKLVGGVRGLARSSTGKAVGAVGGTAAGLLGVGALAGRSSAPRQQGY